MSLESRKPINKKADLLRPWLKDKNERVASVAKRVIHLLEQQAAAENKYVQEEIAMRKLEYDEPLLDDKSPNITDSSKSEQSSNDRCSSDDVE